LRAAEDDGGRLQRLQCALESVAVEATGKGENPEAGTPQRQIERLGVHGLHPGGLVGLQQQDPGWTRRRRGKAAGVVQPTGGPAAAELQLGGALRVLYQTIEGGKQKLLD